MIPTIVKDSLASISAVLWARRYQVMAGIALIIAWFATCQIQGCVHRDGTRFTQAEIVEGAKHAWKLTREAAVEVCRVYRAGRPLASLLSADVPQAVVVLLVSDLVCAAVNAENVLEVIATRQNVEIIRRIVLPTS